MPGLTSDEKKAKLARMSYTDFLTKVIGAHPDVDEVDAHVRRVMQKGLDELAAKRRFPILG